jgi:hypothetical protein
LRVSREHQTLLVLVLGLIMVAGSLTIPNSERRSAGHTLAMVNDATIERSQFDAAAGRVGAYSQVARQDLLRYMIDEELLVQRASEIGLLDSDQQLRRLTVRLTIDTLTREARTEAASDRDLNAFYLSHPELSGPRYLFAIEAARLTGNAAVVAAKQNQIADRITRTCSLVCAARQYGALLIEVPSGLSEPREFVSRLGGDVVSGLLDSRPGQLLTLRESSESLLMVQVVERQLIPPAVEWPAQRAVVEAAYRAAAASRELCERLKVRWRTAPIWLSAEFGALEKARASESCVGHVTRVED